MNKWESKSFDKAPIEIIDGDRGVNYPAKSDFNKNGYCLFLSTSNVTSTGFSFNAMDFISKEKDEVLRKGKLKRDDIVLTTRGTVGNVAYFNSNVPFEHIRINSGMVILRSNNKELVPYYLYLFLRSDLFKTQVISQGSGSAQPQLPIGSLKNIVFPWKDISTQEKIVAVLSPLDFKIELNYKTNAELEAMAKIIYDYWFVQFDFPNAKGKPYKSSGGKMVWNEELRREIPDGWGVELMQDWLDINKSGDWGKEEPEGNYTTKVSCIRGADINGINGKGECDPPVRYILEKNANKILSTHDLVIEISGGSPTQSTGRLTYITEGTLKRFENPLICSNFCRPVSIKNKKLLYNFVYYWNSLYDAGIFFGYEGKTSGIKNLLLDSFISSYYTVVPEEDVVNKFYDLMENIQAKKQIALAENKRLAELRDWLLPMLMNGQVILK